MKSTVKTENTINDSKYPYLGVFYTGKIVLFVSPKTGTCIKEGDNEKKNVIGEHSQVWVEDSFKPFRGTVTLEND